jgi:Phage minor structural protein GP20
MSEQDGTPTDIPSDAPKTFSQEQVDRMIQDRLARLKPTKPEDYDDLKAKATKLAELEAAQLTETERLQAERDAIKAERDAAKAEIEAARGEAKAQRIAAAILAEAAKQKAIDPTDVVALIAKDAVTIGDDGQVTGAEDAVKALLEAKPHLVGVPKKPQPDPGQGARTPSGPSVDAGRDLYRERHAKKTTPAFT